VGYEFEWDSNKAASNLVKHGVDFDEATTVFGDPRAVNMHDPMHSATEHRFVLLGTSSRGRVLIVCYTDRQPRTRLISARRASRAERRQYESL
jgi:uncharacterized protein